MLRKIIGILLIALIIGGGVAYYMWNKPHKSAEGAKPVATLTAEELFAQYSADAAGSDAKYLDKVIEVSGNISSVSVNELNETKVALSTSDMLAEIAFIMKKGESVENLKTGTNIALKGICAGFNTDVELKESVIVHQ
jgi:tRNA_anti-like